MQPTVQSEQDKMVPIDTSGDPVEIEVKEDEKKVNETKEEIAYCFKTIGADVRKSSWTDFEITDKNYEFEIIGEKEILITGEINLNYFDTFIEDLKDLDLKFTMELYEENGQEIKIPQSFIWLTLYQIKELIKHESWVNPHIRGIISHL